MKFPDIGQLLLKIFLWPFMWAVEKVFRLAGPPDGSRKAQAAEGCVIAVIAVPIAVVFWVGSIVGLAVWWFKK
jgi:hypothetical protein